MNKSIILIGLVLGMILISGCSQTQKEYICQQDSDCVISVNIGACCNCPSVRYIQQVEDDKDLVVFLSEEHIAAERERPEECKDMLCKTCQSIGIAKCVNQKCIMQLKESLSGAEELCGNMTFAEAMQIAKDSDCIKEGGLKSTHFCNEITGTWWIDLDIQKQGCSPACVINVSSKQAEINWRCTGLITPETIKGITVRQSGGAAMLIMQCSDREYISNTSDYIIEGTVEKAESRWNDDNTRIFTYTELSVEKYVKGNPLDNNKIEIVTSGGTVGEITEAVEDQPIFHEGKKVRIYFKADNNGFSIVCAQMGVEEI